MIEDDDDRDLAIHAAIESFVLKLGKANGLSRVEVLDRMIGFIENDDEGEVLISRPAAFMVGVKAA